VKNLCYLKGKREMEQFRFAILGAGKIAAVFCRAAAALPDAVVAAVASKDEARAERFAAENGVPRAYGDYRLMLEREKPDCAYIAVTPNDHFRLTMLCLEYGIPVLCEKAMFESGAEAERAFAESEQKGIFVMEAMWSRFLPAVRKAKEWLRQGKIGEPALLQAAIGFAAPRDAENRYMNPQLGGGAAKDILVYCYELATFFMERKILRQRVSAVWGGTGVDLTDHVVLEYGDALASLTATFAAPVEEALWISGPDGRIAIPYPHHARECSLFCGRDLAEKFEDDSGEPGFCGEIREVMRCVREGAVQSERVPHRDTLACARLFDEIRKTAEIK
jgi:predicted dehydrogenase